MNLVKIVVTVPETHAEGVRTAMCKAGAGRIGNYSCYCFSTKGVGHFVRLEDAPVAPGEVAGPKDVVEERIEIGCVRENIAAVIAAVRAVHPYEEPAIDVYLLEAYDFSHG